MKSDLLIDLLRSDGSIIVNKRLIHGIGVRPAVIYSELLSKYTYFKNKKWLTEEGYFFCTIEDLEFSTGLNRHSQDKSIKVLVEKGLIDKKVKGLPAKRYFKINTDSKLMESVLKEGEHKMKPKKGVEPLDSPDCESSTNKIVKDSQNSSQEINKQDSERFTGNNTNINNTKKNTNIDDREKNSSSLKNLPDKIDSSLVKISALITEEELVPYSWKDIELFDLASYFLLAASQFLDKQNDSILRNEEKVEEMATNLGIVLNNFEIEMKDFPRFTVKFLEQYKKINGDYKYLGYITPKMMGNMRLVENILENIDWNDYKSPDVDIKKVKRVF